jgi:hypothetical protein
MSNTALSLILFLVLIFFLAAGIIYAIRKKNTQSCGSFASMAAFHDMQSKEKQNAVEIVIEMQAGKKWEEQKSGQGKNNS